MMPVARQPLKRPREKKERLEDRVSAEQKELFSRAASLQGSTLTDFIVKSAYEAVVRTVQEHELITLNGEDSQLFVNALLNPPEPGENLRAAAEEYRGI